MKKTFVNTIFLTVIASLTTSCATLVNGPTQKVCFLSEPSNANIIIDGRQVGRTPAKIALARRESHQVCIELPGYESYETTLVPTASAWLVGNVVFGGIIGIAVDVATGSLYRLTPDDVNPCLAKADSSSDEFLTVRLVNDVDPSWEKIGQLVATK